MCCAVNGKVVLEILKMRSLLLPARFPGGDDGKIYRGRGCIYQNGGLAVKNAEADL